MNKSVRRRLARAARESAPAPEIDTSGMSPADQVFHAAKRYGLRALIERANLLDLTDPLPEVTDATPAVMAARIESEPVPINESARPREPALPLSWAEEHLGRGNRILGPEPKIPGTNGRALTVYDCLDDEWDE